MDVLIIVKWLTDYSGNEHYAPSIITTMINMALNGGKIEGTPFLGSKSTNAAISIILLGNFEIFFIFLVIALITVPWMLFAKPLALRSRNKNVHNYQALNS
jgi:hypothetical protein